MNKKPNIQLQYEGFLNTPNLWKTNPFQGLYQFEIPPVVITSYDEIIPSKIRLGKLVERFVYHEFHLHKSIHIIAENLQVIEEKLTLGEIDCLLRYLNDLIHLEISYKFYLYDKKSGDSEIDRWIGPNRKDSLAQKISKIKNKQFPILFHKETHRILNKLDIRVSEINQMVYFKAQLFVPFPIKTVELPEVNNECIKGFYLRKSELNQFNDYVFHIPSKMDWLIDVNDQVGWINYKEFSTSLRDHLENERSPLCWLKDSKGNIRKFFVVWW